MIGAVEMAGQQKTSSHELLDRVEYRLVQTDVEKEEIYRLRYRAYLQEGAIEANRDERLTDRYDDAPNSWIFGIHVDGRLASSIRISVASNEHPNTPAADAFNDLLGPEIAQGKIIVDPNRFVADPDNRGKLPELPYLTVRLGYAACAYFEADIGTATVRAEHRAFYRRVFLQQPRCEPRAYPTLVKPLCLMTADYAETRERVFARFPYMRSGQFERRMLFGRDQAAIVSSTLVPPLQQMHGAMSRKTNAPLMAPAA